MICATRRSQPAAVSSRRCSRRVCNAPTAEHDPNAPTRSERHYGATCFRSNKTPQPIVFRVSAQRSVLRSQDRSYIFRRCFLPCFCMPQPPNGGNLRHIRSAGGANNEAFLPPSHALLIGIPNERNRPQTRPHRPEFARAHRQSQGKKQPAAIEESRGGGCALYRNFTPPLQTPT